MSHAVCTLSKTALTRRVFGDDIFGPWLSKLKFGIAVVMLNIGLDGGDEVGERLKDATPNTLVS